MKNFLIGLAMISGWGVAAWLFVSNGPAPIVLGSRDAAADAAGGEIGKLFRDWSADPALAGALVGLCVLDARGRTIHGSSLAETALCPASSLKTVTTGAAFELLGPDFRFETKLASSAAIGPEGVLAGDLVLHGSGDPTLSSADLEALADATVKAGLKQVRGELRIDATVFPRSAVNDHWNWGDIGNAYGAGAYGVNVDHNRLGVRFAPAAAAGGPAEMTAGGPVARGTRWINRVTTGPPGSGDGVVIYSEPYSRAITLEGTVPAGEVDFAVTGAIPDPPALAKDVLEARLKKAGVIFSGTAGGTDAKVTLATHTSAPLAEIVDHLHKVSDNLEAQCLFLTMGNLQQGDPAEVVRKHWESRGVSFTGLRLIDGSGLARANMIRPLDLARVNHAARHGKHGERFRQGLSSYLEGTVRSKLGAMSGVKTEVGFLTLNDGREVTFALMANGLGPDVDFWNLRGKLLSAIRDEG